MVSRFMLLFTGIAMLAPSANAQNVQPESPITRQEFKELMETVKKIDSDNGDIKQRLTTLESKVTAVTNLQVEDRAQLQQIAQQDKNGRSYLRIDASHEPTKLELRRAMDEVAPTTGDLTVYNDMNYDQYISINGQTKFVMARDYIAVPVPVGEIRYKIRGEGVQVKTLGYPGYRATIHIIPKLVQSEWISSGPIYWPYIYQ